jgi:hypothetical protein
MSKGKVINCFYDGSESGFGDFLRGSIHLFDMCKYHKLEFDIDISHHPINKYIFSDYSSSFPKSKIECVTKTNKEKYGDFHMYSNYKKVLYEKLSSIKENETSYIFSNFSFLCNVHNEFLIDTINKTTTLNNECCEFFQERLKFSDTIVNSVEKELKNKNIKEFNLLHFRLGDDSAFRGKNNVSGQFVPGYDEIFDICQNTFKKHGSKDPLVIISDSNDLKEYTKERSKNEKLPFFIFHLNSEHMQKQPSSIKTDEKLARNDDNLFYAAFDMKLVSMAKSAESYSVYSWGSGFLTWIAKIYKVPVSLTQFKQTKLKIKT